MGLNEGGQWGTLKKIFVKKVWLGKICKSVAISTIAGWWWSLPVRLTVEDLCLLDLEISWPVGEIRFGLRTWKTCSQRAVRTGRCVPSFFLTLSVVWRIFSHLHYKEIHYVKSRLSGRCLSNHPNFEDPCFGFTIISSVSSVRRFG